MDPTEPVLYLYLMMEAQLTSESLCFYITEINENIQHVCHKPLDNPTFEPEQFSNFNNGPPYTTFNFPSWHYGYSQTG
jgi:hypothetical protein